VARPTKNGWTGKGQTLGLFNSFEERGGGKDLGREQRKKKHKGGGQIYRYLEVLGYPWASGLKRNWFWGADAKKEKGKRQKNGGRIILKKEDWGTSQRFAAIPTESSSKHWGGRKGLTQEDGKSKLGRRKGELGRQDIGSLVLRSQ